MNMQKVPETPITIEVRALLEEYTQRLMNLYPERFTESDPEAWRDEYRKKQAAGVKFEKLWYDGFWRKGECDFTGIKKNYREVPLEQPAIGVISSFNKWDRALTEKEISDLFSGKVRPEDIPQEVSAECQNALEHLAKTYSADKGTAQLNPTIPPHAAERALWKAQREAGTNEIWQMTSPCGRYTDDIPVEIEPDWMPHTKYRVKSMKLVAKIVRNIPMTFREYEARLHDWEFFGTREEYIAECEKYGYFVTGKIKEVGQVKPKMVKYTFALVKVGDAVSVRFGSDKENLIEFAKNSGYTIIGDIEEREV